MSLASNNKKVEIDQATIDLINAAILSNKTVLQQQLLSSLEERQRELIQQQATTNQHKGSKRSLESTGESNESGRTTTPKRPGRKPLDKSTIALDADLDPKAKRKAQNRRAQRAFRERKEQHVSELQDRIKELEDMVSKSDKDLVQENERLKLELKKLQDENYALKDAQFTFEFPPPSQAAANANVKEQEKDASPSNTFSSSDMTPTTPYYQSFVDESSSSSEQSPLSLAQEEDSDANTSSATPFLSFGSVSSTTSPYIDFTSALSTDPSSMAAAFATPTATDLATMDATTQALLASVQVQPHAPMANTEATNTTNTTNATTNATLHDTNNASAAEFKQLFHGKDDLFTGYRAPTTDLTLTDDVLFDGFSSLFDDSDPLYNFPSQQQHTKFSLGDFYFPDQHKVKHEALEQSLLQAKNDGLRAYEVQKELKQCPDFNLDALCDDLNAKASCSESKYVLSDHDVKLYMRCF
ncbi:hypothetical protein BC940DRAFT_310018, partial [Gongronella butleri]